MKHALKQLIAEAAEIVTQLLGALLLISGFTVCIALATFLAHTILQASQTGASLFFKIMGLQGVAILEPIHEFLLVFNWTALVCMTLLVVFQFAEHLYDLLRSVPKRPMS
jgi:hypothetical protein